MSIAHKRYTNKAKTKFTWEYAIRIPTGKFNKYGKPITKQKTKAGFRTQKEAEKAGFEFLKEAESGNVVMGKNATFGEVARNFLNHILEDPEYEEGTYANYEGFLRNHLEDLQHIYLKCITDSIIEQWKKKMLKKKASASLINDCRKFIFAVYTYARKKLKIINKPPFEDFEKLSVPKRRRNRLMTKEIITVLNKCVEEFSLMFFCIFCIAIGSGLRQGEILGLKYSDINFSNGEVYICRQKTRGKIKEATKTDGSTRIVDFTPFICEILKVFRRIQIENSITCDYIFVNPDTMKVISQKTVDRRFKTLLTACGYDEHYVRFHDIRGSFYDLMKVLKVPSKYASEKLGHSRPGFSEEIYSFPTQETTDFAKNQLESNVFNFIDKSKIKLSANL